MLDEISRNPLFGISLTLTVYAIGLKIYKHARISILFPVITASAILIALVLIFRIPIANYQEGGSIISLMLIPATVSLAIPLYRQRITLKKHSVIILASIAAGSVVSIISTILFARLFRLPEALIISLIPKSVTTPIAIELSERLGGLPSITAIAVILTGIIGAVTGPRLLKLFGIKGSTEKGLAMGTAAHAIGTSRALEMGEAEGANGGLAIGIAGIITAVIAPVLTPLFL